MQSISPFVDAYTVQSPGRIEIGPGRTAELSSVARQRDATSALLVTDADVKEAGVLEPARAALAETGCSVQVYDGVKPEPKLAMPIEVGDRLREGDHDLVVGIGGGSSMDTAKFGAVLAAHDEPPREMLGMGNVPGPGRPVALLPTTAGTGSEVTHIGVFADEADAGAKKVVYSPHLFADVAIVDPDLTATMPAGVAAATGMDALTHAVEAYVTRLRNPYTDVLARGAIELIGANLRAAVHQGDVNADARHAMSLAATLAGQAFVNSGLGAVHALTYPLGMAFELGHGRANAILLPHVMEYNVPTESGRFADIATLLGEERAAGESDRAFAYRGVGAVFDLLGDIGIPTAIGDLGDLDESDFERFADIALEHSAHNIERNPRALDRGGIIELFRRAY